MNDSVLSNSKPSEIADLCGRLESAISNLDATEIAMHKRLTPVLRTPTGVSGGAVPVAKPTGSPMGMQLSDQVDRVNGIADRLTAALDLLAI